MRSVTTVNWHCRHECCWASWETDQQWGDRVWCEQISCVTKSRLCPPISCCHQKHLQRLYRAFWTTVTSVDALPPAVTASEPLCWGHSPFFTCSPPLTQLCRRFVPLFTFIMFKQQLDVTFSFFYHVLTYRGFKLSSSTFRSCEWKQLTKKNQKLLCKKT